MNRVVVITGASRGFGLSLVQEFAATDWTVIGTGRSERPQEFPANAMYEQFDASNPKACTAFWGALQSIHPEASICLINNAGAYVSAGLKETTAEEYFTQMQGNFFSAVYMTKAMTDLIQSARVLNVISSSALSAHTGNSAHGAAKAAEMHFFQSLQQEFKPEQYQITNLYPNNIATYDGVSDATTPQDLARFVREQAENQSTYYLRDVTIYPRKV